MAKGKQIDEVAKWFRKNRTIIREKINGSKDPAAALGMFIEEQGGDISPKTVGRKKSADYLNWLVDNHKRAQVEAGLIACGPKTGPALAWCTIALIHGGYIGENTELKRLHYALSRLLLDSPHKYVVSYQKYVEAVNKAKRWSADRRQKCLNEFEKIMTSCDATDIQDLIYSPEFVYFDGESYTMDELQEYERFMAYEGD